MYDQQIMDARNEINQSIKLVAEAPFCGCTHCICFQWNDPYTFFRNHSYHSLSYSSHQMMPTLSSLQCDFQPRNHFATFSENDQLPIDHPYYNFGSTCPTSFHFVHDHTPCQLFYNERWPSNDQSHSNLFTPYPVLAMKTSKQKSEKYFSKLQPVAAAIDPHDEATVGPIEPESDCSKLSLTGNFDDDMRKAILYVKRYQTASLFCIDGLIADIATASEDTCRFVRNRLMLGSEEEKRLGFTAILSSFHLFWSDPHGHCIIQDIFHHGTIEMKKEVMTAIFKEGALTLSSHSYGCRVIQKAIKSIDQEDLRQLIASFYNHTLELIQDPNGNHVIQRCIHVMSDLAKSAEGEKDYDLAFNLTDLLQFIIDDVIEHVEFLSVHRYGCRIVQRVIEFCIEKQKSSMLKAVIACHKKILQDQFGNYVVQQTIVNGGEVHRDAILATLTENETLCRLCKHKYASNVVEKMLQFGSSSQKEKIIEELMIANPDSSVCRAIEMAKDPIANYVIKSALENAIDGAHREKLLDELFQNRIELLTSPYAKYIVSKVNDKRNQTRPTAVNANVSLN